MTNPSAPGVVLITGAASGIGEATARRLANDGATALILIDRDEARLNALGDDLESHGIALMLCRQDVADEASWDRVEHGVRHHWQGLDGMVVNAGISDAGPIADLSFEAWRRVMRSIWTGPS